MLDSGVGAYGQRNILGMLRLLPERKMCEHVVKHSNHGQHHRYHLMVNILS